jgi:hypothetical protein
MRLAYHILSSSLSVDEYDAYGATLGGELNLEQPYG